MRSVNDSTTGPIDESRPHVSTLMAPFEYDELAPAELRTPLPQELLRGAVSYMNLAYAAPLGWRPLTLDVHVPKDGVGPHPVVVYVHGGSFLGGIKAMGPWGSLPASGVAVVSVSYRFSGEAQFPEPIEDIRAAIRWARARAAEFNLNPSSIALWGSSAGAYLAEMAGITADLSIGRPIGDNLAESARVTAIINHYGISNFATLREDSFENSPADKDALDRIVRQFLGFDPYREPGRLESISPLGLAAQRDEVPPFLFMHGDSDRRVGIGQSRRLHEGLIALGHRSKFVAVPGADHNDPIFSEAAALKVVVDFLRETWAQPASNSAEEDDA